MNKDKEFFDSCAANWDSIRETNPARLLKLIQMTQIKKGDKILDVGTGTGVLLPYLLAAIGHKGGIIAIDFSTKMLAQAKAKHQNDKNILFVAGDILKFTAEHEQFNAITCLNFYPHMHQHKEDFLKKMLPLLHKDGTLTIFHDISRAQVNSIHAECEEVKEHKLPPAIEVGALLKQNGYELVQAYEDDEIYFVQGRKN